MNVLNDYTRVKTQLIENLSLNSTDDSQLTIHRAGNGGDATKNPTTVDLYNVYVPQAPTSWNFNTNGAWTSYCPLNTVLPDLGTYIVQITYGDAMYCGMFSYNPAKPSIEDEILLHASGDLVSSDGKRERLFARTAIENDHYVLQLATKLPEVSANQSLTVKFRKLL